MNFKNRILPLLLAAIPVAAYYFFVEQNAFNFFFADDFHLFKDIVWMQETDSWLEKFKLLTQQHNEHRIVVPRLITWLDYQLEGSINWRFLILLGNLCWIGIIWLFFRAFQQIKLSFWYFVPVPFLLLQPQYIDNLTWTISIFQQCLILFWAFLSIYLISKLHYKWAAFVTVIATFTHGNGMFVFVVGSVLLLLHKNWKPLIFWLLLMAATLSLYFYHYQAGQNSNLGGSLSNPPRLLAAFGAFNGAFMDVFQPGNLNISILVGWVIVFSLLIINGLAVWQWLSSSLAGRFSFLSKKRVKNGVNAYLKLDNGFFLGCGLFMLITGALVALSRSWGGVGSVVQARYQHFAVVALVLVYLSSLYISSTQIRKIIIIISLPFALIFNALCYYQYSEEIVYRHQQLEADVFNWQQHRSSLQYPISLNNNIRTVVNKSFEQGICKLPETFFSAYEADLLNQLTKTDSSISLKINTFTIVDKDASGSFHRKLLSIENENLAGEIFLLLKSEKQTYLIGTKRNRVGKKKFFLNGVYFRMGFKADVLTESVAPGQYRVGILAKHEGNKSLRYTTQVIEI